MGSRRGLLHTKFLACSLKMCNRDMPQKIQKLHGNKGSDQGESGWEKGELLGEEILSIKSIRSDKIEMGLQNQPGLNGS